MNTWLLLNLCNEFWKKFRIFKDFHVCCCWLFNIFHNNNKKHTHTHPIHMRAWLNFCVSLNDFFLVERHVFLLCLISYSKHTLKLNFRNLSEFFCIYIWKQSCSRNCEPTFYQCLWIDQFTEWIHHGFLMNLFNFLFIIWSACIVFVMPNTMSE